jgi:hypothetical protein
VTIPRFLVLVLLLVGAVIALTSCASQSHSLTDLQQSAHRVFYAAPSTFARELTGTLREYGPDGGVTAQLDFAQKEHADTDGGVTGTEDEGLDLRAYSDRKMKPAIPFAGIAGSLAFLLAVVVGGYLFLSWRLRKAATSVLAAPLSLVAEDPKR